MGAIYKKTFGKLIECIDRATGEPYDDWRTEYLNKPGLIIICRSEKKHPGTSYVYIFPFAAGFNQPWLL